jgi:copper chaperone CopZ
MSAKNAAYRAKIKGMSCASCEQVISNEIKKIDKVFLKSISAAKGEMIYCSNEPLYEKIKKAIEDAGYSLENIEQINELEDKKEGEKEQSSIANKSAGAGAGQKSISAFEIANSLLKGNSLLQAERKLLVAAFCSLAALLFATYILFIFGLKDIPNFTTAYLPLLLLGAISITSLVGAGYHFSSYHKPFSCSIGMMEGMTFGMMAGFMLGAILGASNGMFWGGFLGMAIGCIAGVWAGRSCGVMGVMEGLMAGIMSGTMGAMLSVMLLADPLILFLIPLISLCVIVLMALSYMRIKELGFLGDKVSSIPIMPMATISLFFYLLLSLIIIYGPKSGPVWGG